MRRERSIDPDWFEALYRDGGDPWDFETSAYEAAKYARTLAALPAATFNRALEVGCSIGVLTAALAPRCGELVAIDVSDTALVRAAARCADLEQVRFANMRMPEQVPDGRFDLILLSEVIYYWDSDDLALTAAYLRDAIGPSGHAMLVHWTGPTDYPKSGDDAVAELRGLLGGVFSVVLAERHEKYRLDLWRRT